MSAAAVPPTGARPGVVAGDSVSAVVPFITHDPHSHDAPMRTQDGRFLIT